MLEIRHMTELDLNGVLFSLYPSHMSFEESRERLEYDIEMVHDYIQMHYTEAEKTTLPDDNPDTPYISPCYIYLALYYKRVEAYNMLSPKKQQKELDKAAKKWRENRAKKFQKEIKQ